MTMRDGDPGRPGGIPDGVLVGLLAFLLGLAALVWTSTGLAALFAKGSWPATVTFTRTPGAVRALITQPHDVPGAWPDTDPAALSGWGLFWGLFISQLLILFVLTVFTMGVIARTKSRRTTSRPRPPFEAPGVPPTHTGSGAPGRSGHTAPSPLPTPAQPASDAPGPGPDAPATSRTADPTALPHPARPEPAGTAPGGSGAAVPTAHPAAAPAHPAHPAAQAFAAPTSGPGGTRPAARTPNPATLPYPAPEALPAPATTPTTPAPPAFEAWGPGGGTPGRDIGAAAGRMAYGSPSVRHSLATRALAAAEGSALVLTSSPALWAETKDARAKLGPVLLYDPSHLCDTPARMHWNPTDACADRDIAAARAIALLAPVRPQARMDAAIADTAETLLRSWLQAAALDDRPFKQLHRWAQGNSAQDPVRILRTHRRAAPGAAGELESALTAHPERREQAQYLTARALSCLTSIHIREACNTNRTDALTLASFVSEGGTLYVVGEPLEDPRTHPGAMPLLTALTASVVEHGRRMAARSSHGRLDPPLTLVLEDIAAVAPIPRLPELLQEDTLPLLALCRSREQARARWPEAVFEPTHH
ncbi:type VI secretion protein [Streptomyces sp. NPDC059456]|uniref:type VI secretion protein n=1 Tax=Streptomyces sp. NPDC059456 TaxID=3346838 RepID=UPI00367871D8